MEPSAGLAPCVLIMPQSPIPPSPSRWNKRCPVIVIALLACGIATYLGLYQGDVLAHVWEPFFGNGSHQILKESSLARSLPIPDAILGAIAYFSEAVLESLGGEERWRLRPWLVLLVGLLSAGLGLAGLTLVLCQAFVFRAFCTLCLGSALCSFILAALVAPEVLAAWKELHKQGSKASTA